MILPCPVCRTGARYRRDLKTCGNECAAIWRTWSNSQKAKAIEFTNNPRRVEEELAKIKEWQAAQPETETTQPADPTLATPEWLKTS